MKLSPLPATPETVALYPSAEGQRGRAPSTFGRRLAAIRLIHLGARLPSPHDLGARLPSPHDAIEVTEVLRGIRRDFGGLPVMKMPATLQSDSSTGC